MATLTSHPVNVVDHASTDISKADGNPSLKVVNTFVQDVQDVLKTESGVKDDLKKLSDDLIALELNFNDVTGVTIKLDNWNILSRKFAPDWQQLHNDYTSLMHASRGISADISNELANFMAVNIKVLKNQNLDIERKKRSLSKCIQKLDSFIPTANDNALPFLQLRKRVLGSKDEFLAEIKREKMVDKELEELAKKVEQLQSTLKGSSSIIKKSWNFLVERFPNACGTANAGPTASVNMPQTSRNMDAILSKLQSDLAKVQDKDQNGLNDEETTKLYSTLEVVLEEAKNMRKQFANVVLDLDKAEILLAGLAKKLVGITYIWKSMEEDCERLLSGLNDMNDAEDDYEFDLFVTTMVDVYEKFKDGLEAFCLAVRE